MATVSEIKAAIARTYGDDSSVYFAPTSGTCFRIRSVPSIAVQVPPVTVDGVADAGFSAATACIDALVARDGPAALIPLAPHLPSFATRIAFTAVATGDVATLDALVLQGARLPSVDGDTTLYVYAARSGPAASTTLTWLRAHAVQCKVPLWTLVAAAGMGDVAAVNTVLAWYPGDAVIAPQLVPHEAAGDGCACSACQPVRRVPFCAWLLGNYALRSDSAHDVKREAKELGRVAFAAAVAAAAGAQGGITLLTRILGARVGDHLPPELGSTDPLRMLPVDVRVLSAAAAANNVDLLRAVWPALAPRLSQTVDCVDTFDTPLNVATTFQAWDAAQWLVALVETPDTTGDCDSAASQDTDTEDGDSRSSGGSHGVVALSQRQRTRIVAPSEVAETVLRLVAAAPEPNPFLDAVIRIFAVRDSSRRAAAVVCGALAAGHAVPAAVASNVPSLLTSSEGAGCLDAAACALRSARAYLSTPAMASRGQATVAAATRAGATDVLLWLAGKDAETAAAEVAAAEARAVALRSVAAAQSSATASPCGGCGGCLDTRAVVPHPRLPVLRVGTTTYRFHATCVARVLEHWRSTGSTDPPLWMGTADLRSARVPDATWTPPSDSDVNTKDAIAESARKRVRTSSDATIVLSAELVADTVEPVVALVDAATFTAATAVTAANDDDHNHNHNHNNNHNNHHNNNDDDDDDDDDEQNACAVCYERLPPAEIALATAGPCAHLYHAACAVMARVNAKPCGVCHTTPFSATAAPWTAPPPAPLPAPWSASLTTAALHAAASAVYGTPARARAWAAVDALLAAGVLVPSSQIQSEVSLEALTVVGLSRGAAPSIDKALPSAQSIAFLAAPPLTPSTLRLQPAELDAITDTALGELALADAPGALASLVQHAPRRAQRALAGCTQAELRALAARLASPADALALLFHARATDATFASVVDAALTQQSQRRTITARNRLAGICVCDVGHGARPSTMVQLVRYVRACGAASAAPPPVSAALITLADAFAAAACPPFPVVCTGAPCIWSNVLCLACPAGI